MKKIMKNTFKIAIVIGLLIGATQAQAVYISNVKVISILVLAGGHVHFKLSEQPQDSCRHYGFDFRFDASTDGGDEMLKSLRIAKLVDKFIGFGYKPSTTAGATHANGCKPDTMAVPTNIVSH